MKTSNGRKVAIATLLTLLLASSAFTVGSAPVPSPTNSKSSSCAKIGNATLANNVRDKLAKTMSPLVMEKIEITAKNRVVTLGGTATFSGTKTRAASLARTVQCVSRVINKIKVVPPTEECSGGFQNCCCPNDGCICARICLPCGPPKPTHRRGRR